MKVTLRAARINAGLCQHQAAIAAGVTQATISSWERCKSAPSWPKFKKLCERYGCAPDDIIVETK